MMARKIDLDGGGKVTWVTKDNAKWTARGGRNHRGHKHDSIFICRVPIRGSISGASIPHAYLGLASDLIFIFLLFIIFFFDKIFKFITVTRTTQTFHMEQNLIANYNSISGMEVPINCFRHRR